MAQSVVHVVDTPALSQGEPAPTLPESPTPQAPQAPPDAPCVLTVTLRDSGGALGRIAATLSSTPVLALSYTVLDAGRATAEIRVPRARAARARAKLNRMVDVLAVTEPQPAPSTAG